MRSAGFHLGSPRTFAQDLPRVPYDCHLRRIGRFDAAQADSGPLRAVPQGPVAVPRVHRRRGASPFSDDAWRERLAASTAEFAADEFDQDSWREFAQQVHYHAGDVTQQADLASLATLLGQLEQGGPSTRLYYLATSPTLYEQAVARLGEARFADESGGERRIVIEKPFGTDLQSARKLNEAVHQVFRERQIYRIDHYLGKETVQNLMVLRFANSIFEPVWNRNYVDHVQITVAEEVMVGSRGPYYDQAGVLRDVFQNHLLQLMTITAMEAPARYQAQLVRDEKVKVLQSIRPLAGADFAQDTLRGQYDGYRREPGVAAGSQTATFAAIKLHIDNWRWQGVPFYLRSGKAMSCRTTQIVIQFRRPPHMLFSDRPVRGTRSQSAGDPDPAGRGHPAAFPDQGAGCGHADAA